MTTDGDYAYWTGRLSVALRLFVEEAATKAQVRSTLKEFDEWCESEDARVQRNGLGLQESAR